MARNINRNVGKCLHFNEFGEFKYIGKKMVSKTIDDNDFAKDISWQLVEKSVSYNYILLPDGKHEFTVNSDAEHIIDEIISKGPNASDVVKG